MSSKWKKTALLAARLALGAVFVVSGYSKLMRTPEDFAAVILSYKLVGGHAAIWMARILPWAELIAGAFFVTGLWLKQSLAALWLMNTAFIFALTSVLIRKIPIGDCGCFGEGIAPLAPSQTLAIDIVLCAIFFMLARNLSENK
jgi:hypothetical protein